jgi:hypothetical protein
MGDTTQPIFLSCVLLWFGLGFGGGSAAGLGCSKRSLPKSPVQASEQCDDSHLELVRRISGDFSVWIEIAQISLANPAEDPASRINLFCSVCHSSDRDLLTLHALAQLLTRNYR